MLSVKRAIKAPAIEEALLRKRFQTSGKQCFLAVQTNTHFTENKCLRMPNLRNEARATLDLVNIVSSVCKRGIIWCGNSVSEKKSETSFASRKQKCFRNKCARKRGKHLGRHSSARMFLQRFLVCGGL